MMFFDMVKIWARFDDPAVMPRNGQGKGTKRDPENATVRRGTQNRGRTVGRGRVFPERGWGQQQLEKPVLLIRWAEASGLLLKPFYDTLSQEC